MLLDLVEGNVDTEDFDKHTVSTQNSPKRPLNDRKARSIRTAKGLDGTEKPMALYDAAKSAYQILHVIFRSSHPRHLEVVLSATTSFLDEYATKGGPKGDIWRSPGWCRWFASRFIEWTQAQYRFAVISFWLGELESLQSTSAKQDTTLDILITLLSSPNTAVVNLAIGDVLSCLSRLLIRTPGSAALRQAILAISAHIYYSDQINDLVGDLLATVMELEGQPNNAQAVKVLLGCVREVVASNESTADLSRDYWDASLGLLRHHDSAVRTEYLVALQAVLANFVKCGNSTAETGTTPRISLPHSETASFAQNLLIRLYSTFQTTIISQGEAETLAFLLQTMFELRDGQMVQKTVPVLVTWESTVRKNGEQVTVAQILAQKAFSSLLSTWLVSGTNPIQALSVSSSLQQATSSSAADLLICLSHPFDCSPKTTSSPPASVKESTPHVADTRGTPRPISIHNISLADLKHSLMQAGSPAHNSGASSVLERATNGGSSLNGSADGHARQTSSLGDGLSPVRASPQRRLDKLTASAEERQMPQRWVR